MKLMCAIQMSYEKKMLEDLQMPARRSVEDALLKSLFIHNGVIKEFGVGEDIVNEIANEFGLNEKQRMAYLETFYRKEKRVKKSLLWHRLLFRAADSLAKGKLVTRPTQTFRLTNKREWMLTEKGFDRALSMMKIPNIQKQNLSTRSYEVQKIIKKLKEIPRPEHYNPFDKEKKSVKTTREYSIRTRGFRQAVVEAYDFKCAICGMKLRSPDSLFWEVEAAHIVPHSSMGKDDIWNGLSLCRLHHWTFDVGWFTLLDNYSIKVSSRIEHLPKEFGRMGDFNFASHLVKSSKILLPSNKDLFPHQSSIQWHRSNVFFE